MSEKFDIAIKLLFGLEGFYSNNKADPGGSTLYGISRVYHPNWTGWKEFDSGKSEPSKLETLAKEYYKAEFWDKMKCEEFPTKIAIKLFESGVNIGTKRAVMHLQKAANLLTGRKIAEDGIVGPDTVKQVFLAVTPQSVNIMSVVFWQSVYQSLVYEGNKNKNNFIRGWTNRLVNTYRFLDTLEV